MGASWSGPIHSLWTLHIQALQNVPYFPPKHPSPLLFFAVFLLCLSILWTQLVVYLVQPQHCGRASLPGALLHHEQLGPLRWWIPQQAGRSVFRFPPRGEGSISDEQVTGASKTLRSAKFREGSHFGDVSLRKYYMRFGFFHDGLVFLASLNLTYPDVNVLMLLFMAVYKAGEL